MFKQNLFHRTCPAARLEDNIRCLLDKLELGLGSMYMARFYEHDPYLGMGSILFPSMTRRGALEQGLWCRGCGWLWQQISHIQVTSNPTKSELEGWKFLCDVARCARTKDDFLEHVKHCPAAEKLPECDWGDRIDDGNDRSDS